MSDTVETAVNSAPVAAPSTTTEPNAVPAAPTVEQSETPENANSQAQPVLTTDESKYLQSQNINLADYGIDQSNHQAVDNFINLHKQLRQQKSEERQQANATQVTPQDVLGAQSQTPTVPTQPQVQPVQQPQPIQPVQQPVQHFNIREMDIINMQSYLSSRYPQIKDKVGNKEFYDGMRQFGLNPVNAGGDFNLSAIDTYANYLNTQAENVRLKAEAIKANPALIPDASNRIDVTLNSIQANGGKMSLNDAYNVVMQYNQDRKSGKALGTDDQALYNQAVAIIERP